MKNDEQIITEKFEQEFDKLMGQQNQAGIMYIMEEIKMDKDKNKAWVIARTLTKDGRYKVSAGADKDEIYIINNENYRLEQSTISLNKVQKLVIGLGLLIAVFTTIFQGFTAWLEFQKYKLQQQEQQIRIREMQNHTK